MTVKTYISYEKYFMGCNFNFSGSVAFGKHIPRVATNTRERVQTHANPKSRLQGAVRSKLLISSKNSKNYGSQQLYSGKIRSCNKFDVKHLPKFNLKNFWLDIFLFLYI